jgi:large subunit ribosomal protein L30
LATLDSLGLNKPGKEVVKEVNDAINGMIKKVKHLVAIEEIEE